MPLPISELQKLDQSEPLIEIVEIDATRKGGATWFITSHPPFPGPAALYFKSNIVLSIPVETEGWVEANDDMLPKPIVRVSNVQKDFFAAVNSLGDMSGCTVRRYLIFAKNLDNGSAPDSTKASEPSEWLIERMQHLSEQKIEWSLMVPFELPNLRIPRERVLRDKGFPGAGKWRG